MLSAKTDFKDIYRVLGEELRGEMWQFVGQKMKAKVKDLMTNGIDVDGNAYKKYSSKYSTFKSKKGLSTSPNLQLTSLMWKAIQARHTVNFFEIYIISEFEEEKAVWNNPSRKFFEWGSELYKEFELNINEYIQRSLF